MRKLRFTPPTHTEVHGLGLKPKANVVKADADVPQDTMWDKMRSDKKRAVPVSGFNFVGCDDFEDPGEQLYVIRNFATRAEAEQAQKDYKVEYPDERTYIYSPED